MDRLLISSTCTDSIAFYDGLLVHKFDLMALLCVVVVVVVLKICNVD